MAACHAGHWQHPEPADFSQACGLCSGLQVRQSAGLYLKNNLKAFGSSNEQHKQFIKEALLHVLHQPQRSLRQTAGTAIASIVVQIGLAAWPELVQALITLLSASTDANALSAGLDTLYKAGWAGHCNMVLAEHTNSYCDQLMWIPWCFQLARAWVAASCMPVPSQV